jgi:ATP-binding cassette subfamily C (CFTR/MRP) protein 1
VALNLILSFNTDIMLLIKSWTVLETSIGAVSRIQDFVSNTPSENQPQATVNPRPDDWPCHGEVIFRNVTAAYK